MLFNMKLFKNWGKRGVFINLLNIFFLSALLVPFKKATGKHFLLLSGFYFQVLLPALTECETYKYKQSQTKERPPKSPKANNQC